MKLVIYRSEILKISKIKINIKNIEKIGNF